MSKALIIALILAALAVATYVRAQVRMRAAVQAYPPSGQITVIDGQTLHIRVIGDTGPDVVLVHGASGNMRDFTHDLAGKLAQEYRVFLVDRPGLGHSAPLPGGGTITRQAELIRAAVTEAGASDPVVVGQSYGGAVALAWATDAPGTMAALVSIAGPSHTWDGPPPTLYRLLSLPVFGPALSWILTAWVPQSYVDAQIAAVFTPDAEPPGYADHIGAPLLLRPAQLRANALQRAHLKPQIGAMMPAYPTLPMPIEIIHGTADTTVSPVIHAEKLIKDAPTARYTPLLGIGHMPHHAAQTQVIKAIHRAAARAGLRPAP